MTPSIQPPNATNAIMGNGELTKLEFNDFIIEEVTADDPIMNKIGAFRYRVWQEEGELNESLFPEKLWFDEFDSVSRHWMVYKKEDESREIVASARVTVHPTLETSIDGEIWKKYGLYLEGPVANLSKLVVDKNYRRYGIGARINKLRVEECKEMGCASITTTASEMNKKMLINNHGFRDTGHYETFPDRPNVPFHIIDKVF